MHPCSERRFGLRCVSLCVSWGQCALWLISATCKHLLKGLWCNMHCLTATMQLQRFPITERYFYFHFVVFSKWQNMHFLLLNVWTAMQHLLCLKDFKSTHCNWKQVGDSTYLQHWRPTSLHIVNSLLFSIVWQTDWSALITQSILGRCSSLWVHSHMWGAPCILRHHLYQPFLHQVSEQAVIGDYSFYQWQVYWVIHFS